MSLHSFGKKANVSFRAANICPYQHFALSYMHSASTNLNKYVSLIAIRSSNRNLSEVKRVKTGLQLGSNYSSREITTVQANETVKHFVATQLLQTSQRIKVVRHANNEQHSVNMLPYTVTADLPCSSSAETSNAGY